MPNIKSAKKRLRQSKGRRLRNKNSKTLAKTCVKKFEAAVASNNAETAKQAFEELTRKLDKVAGKGIIHKNLAARKKSRLHKRLQKLLAQAPSPPSQGEAKS